MIYSYYIVQNSSIITNHQALSPGIRIHKLPSHYNFQFTQGNGPYSTLSELKKKSFLFKKIALSNSSRVQKILNPKNIETIKDFIITSKESSVSKEFIQLIEHCIQGKIINNKITGVHYYNPANIRIKKLIEENSYTGVFQAEIDFFDNSKNKWYSKKEPSTFFPKDWNLTILFHECIYAVDRMVKSKKDSSVFTSVTSSGIPVEIIKINDKLKSIYPLLKDIKD